MNPGEAREKLYRLLDETSADREPIQETLYLLSVPGMRESILDGITTPPDRCEKEPGW